MKMEDGVVGYHFQKVTLRKGVYMMSSQRILTTGSTWKADAVVKTMIILMAVLGIQIEGYPTYTLLRINPTPHYKEVMVVWPSCYHCA